MGENGPTEFLKIEPASDPILTNTLMRDSAEPTLVLIESRMVSVSELCTTSIIDTASSESAKNAWRIGLLEISEVNIDRPREKFVL
jgi:hypothetical protein